jgi:predicted enzyme related to lactoylglutathione lyase
MSRVVHFEVHAEEPERAIRFYKQVFEWRFTKFTGPQDYWVIETGPASEPGINGGLMAIPGVGWLLYCKDSEGNVFGMMQPDPQAA